MIYQALAAADQEVLDLASSTVGALKDNVMGVFTQYLPVIIGVVAAILAITFIIRFFRKQVVGRG